VSGQQHAPAALYPRERPGTHFTVGWLVPKAGLDGQKILSQPGFDPGPPSPLLYAGLGQVEGVSQILLSTGTKLELGQD